MNDRPTAIELLEAVRHFLETDVVPALDGPKKFHARVAANVMGILSREWLLEEEQLDAEWNSLTALLGVAVERPAKREDRRLALRDLNEKLCDRIRNGEADGGAWRDEVRKHLRLVVRQKLQVSSPAMLKTESK